MTGVAASSEAWQCSAADWMKPSPRPAALTLPLRDTRFQSGIGMSPIRPIGPILRSPRAPRLPAHRDLANLATLRAGQGDGHRRALVGPALDGQGAAVEADETISVGQAHAALAAGGLGREERVRGLAQGLGVHAGTEVTDLPADDAVR